MVQRNEASSPSNTNQVGPFPGPENNDATGASDLNVAASSLADCLYHKVKSPEGEVGGREYSETHGADTEDSGAPGESNAVDCGSTHNANQLRSVPDDTDSAPDAKSSVIRVGDAKDRAIAKLKVRLLRIRARTSCLFWCEN